MPISKTGNPVSAGPWRDLFRGHLGQLALGLLVLEFTSAIQVFTLSTIMPAVASELNGERWYGFAMTTGVLASIITVPFAGPMAQRIGLRRLLTLATPLFVIGALGATFAWTMVVFIFARFIEGSAAAAMAVFGISAVASEFPHSQRPRLMALMSSMWMLPALIGPPYAALVTGILNWRWSIIALVPFVLFARILVARRITAYHGSKPKRSSMPVKRALLLTVGVSVLMWRTGALDPWGWIQIITGLTLVMIALNGLFPAGTLRARRGPEVAILTMFLLCFTFYGAESFATLMATADLGTSITDAGLALTFGAVCRSTASLIQPKMVEHPLLGLRLTAMLGSSLVIVGLGLLVTDAFSGGHSWAIGLLWLSWAVGGLGMGLCYTPVSVSAFEKASEKDISKIGTSMVLAEVVGALLGISIGAALLTTDNSESIFSGTTTLAFVFFTLCATPLIFTTHRIHSRTPVVEDAV